MSGGATTYEAVYQRFYCDTCGLYWPMVAACKWSMSKCLGCGGLYPSLEIQEEYEEAGQGRLI